MRPAPGRPHLTAGTRVVTTGGRWPGRPAEVVKSNGGRLYLRILLADGMSWRQVSREFVRAVA